MKDHPFYVRCIVSYYATMDLLTYRDSLPSSVTDKTPQEFSGTYYLDKQPEKIVPILIVRAGLDAGKNQAIDTFIAKALANNVAIEVINYPEGHHSFDVIDDTDESRAIIQRTLTFLKEHLAI